MKNFLIIFLLVGICGIACGPAENRIETDDTTKSVLTGSSVKIKPLPHKLSPATKEKILGLWTGGESENATFDIRQDSIYYVDHFESYKYNLIKDSIKISYPDYLYSAKIYFVKDTLVMNSEEDGMSKFWKFKN